jgi:hypothetical protein
MEEEAAKRRIWEEEEEEGEEEEEERKTSSSNAADGMEEAGNGQQKFGQILAKMKKRQTERTEGGENRKV